METLLFIASVTVLAIVSTWLVLKPRKKASSKHHQRRQARKALADQLTTPADYTLARRDHLLHRKRQAAREDVIATNQFSPRSVSGGRTEYDGYSRRDRSHVVVGTAYIKKEEHVEKPAADSSEKLEGQAGQ
jgi:hypothetical protein